MTGDAYFVLITFLSLAIFFEVRYRADRAFLLHAWASYVSSVQTILRKMVELSTDEGEGGGGPPQGQIISPDIDPLFDPEDPNGGTGPNEG